MDKPLKIYLRVIAPVHIGCDDVYEPTGFVIDESRKKLIAFDAMDFIKALSEDERKQFTALCMQGDVSSIPNLYDFMSRRKISGREIDIAAGLTANYQKVKALAKSSDERRIRQELNNFAISRTAYNPYTDMPYIPGSSIKGSLRTAYLNKQAGEAKVTGWKGKAKELEVKLLNGSFETDPFRMVKVSDFLPAGNVAAKIMYAVNKKKKTSKFEARGPFQILEVIQPGAVFEGTVNIQAPNPKAGIQNPITEESLLQSLKNFYGEAFDSEQILMKAIGAEQDIYIKTKESFNNLLGSKAFIVRVGRHSGAEAVTIDDNRSIKIMQGKGKPPQYSYAATTIWLTSENSKATSNTGLLPFGWVLLSLEPLTAQSSTGSDAAIQAQPDVKPKKEEPKPLDKFIAAIKILKTDDAGRLGTTIDEALKKLETDEEKRLFARAVQEHLGKGFKKSKAKVKLEPFLD